MIKAKEHIQLQSVNGPELRKVTEQIHKAVQWIARVANAYIAPRDDDGHTSMDWNQKEEFFYGQEFSDYPLRLGFRPGDFSWLLMDDKLNILTKVGGSGKSDETVWGWLQKALLDRGIAVDSLSYDLAYALPYEPKITTIYSANDDTALKQFSTLRTAGVLITKAALLFSRPSKIYDKICTWPHHFDAGSSIKLFKNGQEGFYPAMGLGMAIADRMISEHYLYVSYWNRKAVFNPSELPDLPSGGYWLCMDGWCGAVLPFSKLSNGRSLELDNGVLFMIAAIETLYEFSK